MLRRLLELLDHERIEANLLTSVTLGDVATNGGGTSYAATRARCFKTLGYATLLLIDGDTTDAEAATEKAIQAGVEVLQWSEGNALEDIVTQALDALGLQAFVDAAAGEIGQESVLASLRPHLPSQLETLDVNDMVQAFGLDHTRSALGAASKGKGANGSKSDGKAWFKREDRGELLADVIWLHQHAIRGSELDRGLDQIIAFVYQSASPKPIAPRGDAPD